MAIAINWEAQREQALGPFRLDILPANIELPALPHAVMMYLQESADENASIKSLAAILQTDAGLTVELLRYVNSAFFGLRTRVHQVAHALQLLGRRQARLLVLTNGAQAAIRARKSRLIHQQTFWNIGLQRAFFASEVAKRLGADAEMAFAGALLQDFLLPVLSNDLFDKYSAFIADRMGQPDSLTQFEQRTFGWDHSLIAAGLAHRWKLPDEITCSLFHHHAGLRILGHGGLARTSVAAVALSALLPDPLRQHLNGLEQLMLLQSKWPDFALAELIRTVDALHASSGLGVKNDFPLARTCRAALGASPLQDLARPILESLSV